VITGTRQIVSPRPQRAWTSRGAEDLIHRYRKRTRATRFGEAHGNYEEFCFFTGLRQSQQFALTVSGFDRATKTLAVRRACVRNTEKNRTQTNQDREIRLSARACAVLERRLALRERLLQSRIAHACVVLPGGRRPAPGPVLSPTSLALCAGGGGHPVSRTL
jgi:hypothetical protein